MRTLVNYCTKALEAFAAAILFVLTMMVFANVVLRYGFNSSITVTEELSQFLFVWLVFSGAILVAGRDAHVRVDLLARKLPPIPRKIMDSICDLVMIYCCYLITIGGWERTVRNMKNHLAVTGLPKGWIYLAGTIAGLVIGLILIVRLISRFLSKPTAAVDTTATETIQEQKD